MSRPLPKDPATRDRQPLPRARRRRLDRARRLERRRYMVALGLSQDWWGCLQPCFDRNDRMLDAGETCFETTHAGFADEPSTD